MGSLPPWERPAGRRFIACDVAQLQGMAAMGASGCSIEKVTDTGKQSVCNNRIRGYIWQKFVPKQTDRLVLLKLSSHLLTFSMRLPYRSLWQRH